MWKIKVEEDIAVNTQGNALFCTILCSWKCRVPFCFESPLFVCLLMTCFSQKIIDKLNNFLLAFCWWYILMMSLVSKVCSIFLWAKTKSHNRANFIQLKSCYCLRPCKFIHVMCLVCFFTLCIFFQCPLCSQCACKWASLHSSIFFICSHLLYFAGENEKQSEFCIVIPLEHNTVDMIHIICLLDILTEQLFILGFT